jgi:hypothetical protein
VDPVPDPLLLRKSGSDGNRTRDSGSAARDCDHQTAEAEALKVQQVRKGAGSLLRNVDVT